MGDGEPLQTTGWRLTAHEHDTDVHVRSVDGAPIRAILAAQSDGLTSEVDFRVPRARVCSVGNQHDISRPRRIQSLLDCFVFVGNAERALALVRDAVLIQVSTCARLKVTIIGRVVCIAVQFALVRHTVRIAITARAHFNVAEIRNRIRVTVLLKMDTVIGDTVVIAVGAESSVDVTHIRDPVVIAICLKLDAFVGNPVAIAVPAGSISRIANIRYRVAIAVIIRVNAFVGHSIAVAILAGPVANVMLIQNAVPIAVC